MKLNDIYVLLLRLAGIVLGYYWVSAVVWAFYYAMFPDDGGGYLIAQYTFQGILLFLLLFNAPGVVRFLFGNSDEKISISGIDIAGLVRAGTVLIGLVLILYGLPSLVLKFFSGHRVFSSYDQGFTLVAKKELVLSVIHIVLGVLVIMLQHKIPAWTISGKTGERGHKTSTSP